MTEFEPWEFKCPCCGRPYYLCAICGTVYFIKADAIRCNERNDCG